MSTLVPAHDLDAEGAVLSAILLDPARLDDVREIVRAEDFYSPANRAVFDAITRVEAESKPVDVVTVAGLLEHAGRLSDIGGSSYLFSLCDGTPAVLHVEAHARAVRDRADQRRIVAVCSAQAASGRADGVDVALYRQETERAVYEACRAADELRRSSPMSELVPQVLQTVGERREAGGRIPGIPTGWTDLDRALHGWLSGKLYCVAGRPGMGKTSFAFNAAVNVARAGYGSVFFSAEMDREDLTVRALASEALIDSREIEAGRLSDRQWSDLHMAAERVRKLPMVIMHCPGATIATIRSAIRREHRRLRAIFGEQLQLGLVAVDYLQILNGERQRGDNENAEITRLSKGLMTTAQELGVAILEVSQLNRSVESRSNKDKRPQLGDLRGSGSIEQDIHAALLLYREEYYDENSTQKGVLEVNVAKNRGGRSGRTHLHFHAQSTRISNLAGHEYDSLTSDFAEDAHWSDR